VDFSPIASNTCPLPYGKGQVGISRSARRETATPPDGGSR